MFVILILVCKLCMHARLQKKITFEIYEISLINAGGANLINIMSIYCYCTK